MKTQAAPKSGGKPDKPARRADLPSIDTTEKLFLSPSRNQVILTSLILGAATFLACARVLQNDFVYLDDRAYVTENATVLRGITWEGVKWAFKSFEGSNWHPLTWLSHMADVSLYDLHE